MQDSTLAPTHNGLSTEPPQTVPATIRRISLDHTSCHIDHRYSFGLTFLFGFGNVLDLALHLGVPVWVAPLVAPAVDLSVIGLLLAIRHLSLAGATSGQLRPGRRLLVFAGVVTLALKRGRSDHRR